MKIIFTSLVKKKILLFIFVILFFFFLFLDKNYSSDYSAYFRRFVSTELYLKTNYLDFFFNFINYVIFLTDFNYEEYLKIIFTIFCSIFFFTIYELLKLNKSYDNKNFVYILILLIFFSILFLFEFLTIRIRAGMCIVMMLASFLFYLKGQNKTSIIFLVCSLLTHAASAIMMFIASFFLVFLVRLKKISGNQETLILIILSFFIIFCINYLNITLQRNSQLINKPLSIYRIILYYIIPALVILNIKIKGNRFLLRKKAENFTEAYLKMFFIIIVTILISIITFGSQFSGQDLVRMFGVMTILMIFTIFNKQYFKDVMILNFYIITINSILFYKNFYYLLK